MHDASIAAWLGAAGFLCGSIPWGLWIGRARGIDIREHGSGNVGATNVWRVLGRTWGLLCFALDAAKGAIPSLASTAMLGGFSGERAAGQSWALVACAAAPIAGHIFNPWLRFKGGKGVATGLGSLLAVYPEFTWPTLAALVAWIITMRLWRYVSLASLCAAATLAFVTAALAILSGGGMAGHAPFVGAACIMFGLVIWTHRANIRRLRAGTELRVGSRQQVPARATEGAVGGDKTAP